MRKKLSCRLSIVGLSLLFLFSGLNVFAQVLPPRPDPPRLVNDIAHMMTTGERDQLEAKLLYFSQETSNEITVVTIDSLGDNDVEDYAVKLGKAWGVGRSGKNNGIVILASLKDHKINISTGKGLEGALTDLQCGRIIRNEMVPEFKEKNYYFGFLKASDAIIAATKGEYKGEGPGKAGRHTPITAIIILVIIVFFIVKMFRRGGGGGGGDYMSRGGGLGNFATGMILGNLLGGRGGGGGGGFGGGGGDSGFGGFGGGDFGGGGASGDW